VERDDHAAVVPEDEKNGEFLTAAKFLSIYDKIAHLIPLDRTAEIRFEYGDENFPPSKYHVENISETRTELRVQVRLPQAKCKARDRREAGAACCGQSRMICHSDFEDQSYFSLVTQT
jgi:hypothetical protein